MADIGPITAKVVATSAGMAGGLSDAEKKLKASTSKMADQAKKDGAAAGKGFASALTQGLVIAGGMKLFDLGAAGLRTVVDLFTGGAARMAEVGKAARQAGADVAGFQVIVEALGNDLPTAVEGVIKLKEAMGKAIVEGANDPFERLGIGARDLLGMREDVAIATVAARLRELGGDVAEARLGVQLFGDKFKDLRHILDDGGEQIRLMSKDLQAFGAAFGEGDFLQSREWTRALNQFSLLWKGLENQIARGLMPVVNEFFERVGSLADMGVTFRGLGDWIMEAAESVALAGAWVIDNWSNAGKIKEAWEAVFTWLKSEFQHTLAELFDILHEATRGTWLGSAVGNSFDSAATALGEHASDNRVAARKMFASLKEAFSQSPTAGGVKEFFAAAKERMREVFTFAKDWDPFALWAESAERLGKSLEGPLDKFREQLKQIGAMQALGREMSETLALAGFGVDPFDDGLDGNAQKSLAGAFQQLKGAFGNAGGYNPAAAMLADSREAYSAIQAFRQSSAQESVEEALKRIMQLQLDEERRQADLGRRVAAATEKLAKNLVPRGID